MFDRLKKQIRSDTEAAVDQSNAVIKLIGDRASGKTTFMAALARFPTASPDSPIQSITAVNDDGNELVAKAQNILEQGLELEPTDLKAKVGELNDYQLTITLRGLSQFRLTGGNTIQLNLSFKDYAGEFFTDLLYQNQNPKLSDYLTDCAQATGIMFLMDGSAQRKDSEYSYGIEKFLNSLDCSSDSSGLKRIALVLTKCELPDLWIKRHQPEKLAQAKFKQVCAKLRAWQNTTNSHVEFFTASAFGVVGSHFPEANSKQQSRDRSGVTSVLKDPQHWKPFGLVSPTYWLCTGERHNKLDQEY